MRPNLRIAGPFVQLSDLPWLSNANDGGVAVVCMLGAASIGEQRRRILPRTYGGGAKASLGKRTA